MATFFVTNTVDSGLGSLREAVSDANGSGRESTIFLNTTGVITVLSALPDVGVNAAFVGPGRDHLTITTSNRFRIFKFLSGATSILSGLTIANGYVSNESGGAIFNAGTLTLKDSVLKNNQTTQAGGAVYNSGSCFVVGSILDNNSAFGANYYDTNGSGGAIFNAGTLTLKDSVLKNNQTTKVGGAVYNSGTCLVIGSVLDNNSAYGYKAYGGAIHSASGSVTVSNSTISHNSASGRSGVFSLGIENGWPAKGGAICVDSGKMEIVASVLFNNSATGGCGSSSYSQGIGGGSGGDAFGGAVCMNNGFLIVRNTTVSANQASGGCAGRSINCLHNGGRGVGAGGGFHLGTNVTAEFESSTIYGNSTRYGVAYDSQCNSVTSLGIGGGIFLDYRVVVSTVFNTLLASNTADFGRDVYGTLSSHGFNLVTSSNFSSGWIASDLVNTNADVGPLQDNGGPTFTHALLSTSPAIDRGRSGTLTLDQRGETRPKDASAIPNADGGDGSDIGAFELDPVLRLTRITTTDNDIRLSFTTVSDQNYRVEVTDALSGNNWELLTNGITGTGGIVTTTNVNGAVFPARFFRVQGQH